MLKRGRQPKRLTRHFLAWPDTTAINLYGGLRCKVIVTVDENADRITVCYPRKGVHFKKMKTSLALRDAKGRRGDLVVTLENKDGTSFILSPTEDEFEDTIEITVPSLVRSNVEYLTTRSVVIAVHNDSNGGRTDSREPDDAFYLGDPGAYKILHRPTFER
jgi:hypothetical protein